MSPLRVLVAVLVMLTASPAVAESNAENAVRVSQAALGRQLPDLSFTRTDGQTVRLSELRGRPLLVSLVYTGCADVCPTLIESLVPAVKAAQAALGSDGFAVITIGFDVRNDTPSRLRSFANSRGANLPGWWFLAADEASLDALAQAVGFGFYSRAGSFDHLAQVSVIDAEGRLYQQIYGAVFEPPLIVEPLKTLVFKRDQPIVSLDRLIDRVKYFCTVYDPSSGRYYFNYSLFMSIGIGIACFGLVLAFVAREWRRSPGRARLP